MLPLMGHADPLIFSGVLICFSFSFQVLLVLLLVVSVDCQLFRRRNRSTTRAAPAPSPAPRVPSGMVDVGRDNGNSGPNVVPAQLPPPSSGAGGAPSSSCSRSPDGEDWVARINFYRCQANVAPVGVDSALVDAATAHSCWMLKNGQLTHDPSPGTPGENFLFFFLFVLLTIFLKKRIHARRSCCGQAVRSGIPVWRSGELHENCHGGRLSGQSLSCHLAFAVFSAESGVCRLSQQPRSLLHSQRLGRQSSSWPSFSGSHCVARSRSCHGFDKKF